MLNLVRYCPENFTEETLDTFVCNECSWDFDSSEMIYLDEKIHYDTACDICGKEDEDED